MSRQKSTEKYLDNKLLKVAIGILWNQEDFSKMSAKTQKQDWRISQPAPTKLIGHWQELAEVIHESNMCLICFKYLLLVLVI